MIRKATPADCAALCDLAKLHAKTKYPELVFDDERAKRVARECISGAAHFAMVSEDEDGVMGGLLAMTGDNMWAQRKHCQVLFWVTLIPGEGAKMLRQFRAWVEARRGIRVAGFSPDLECDPAVWKVAERIDFKRRGGAYLFFN